MLASIEIKNLVDRFTKNISSYCSPTYNETQLRREFLDPFFEALGWDVANKQGYAEAYKEVIHEDAVKIGTATKAPDYSFRVGGTRKFFVEAKKPFINIKDDIDPAFQLRRYAWSAKLPLSILTDFQEFAVYDCRLKPVKTDKASIGRILYIKYDEFEKRWDEIASIFSKDSVLKGSFDRFADTNRAKKGTTEVDDVFLSEIENWRDILSRNIAIRNENLSPRELNFTVQRTIDRLIFLRICEDRGIEDYGRLQAHLNGENVYKRLCVLFREADERYNSGLFHFREEKGREETPDNITLKLDINDKVLKQIIQNLYYPDSAYEFSVLPADILGQVYEQFLGKVIRLTAGHQAKVEDKPEVKKAGGVFYTPTYIVDYILKNTVGKLLEGKTPKQATAFRILDPACGSGSFLIGAYQYLLDWHRDWYTKNDPEKWLNGKIPAIYKARAGEYRLTTPERKKILLNNIYGVDIDTQAVEVTKLSLLLKVLEGENEQSIAQQLKLFHERALPDLGNNIKCGNSLIGTDYFVGVQESMGLFADVDDEQTKTNAFDWNAEHGFQEIMKNGGFDAVIGNPPYIRIQTLQETSPKQVSYLSDHYRSAVSGNYDIYVVFVEKGLQLLCETGKIGFILPHKFFNSQYGKGLREFVSSGKHLSKIIHFGDQQVFKDATTYTCLLFLDKSTKNKFHFSKVTDLEGWRLSGKAIEGKIPITEANRNEWNFNVGESSKVLSKISKAHPKLLEIADRIFQGLVTGADDVFILENRGRSKYFSSATNDHLQIESKLMHPLCKGSLNIKRYHTNELDKSILFPYKIVEEKAELLSKEELENKYPNAWAYLNETKPVLEARERGKWKHDKWYAFGRSQNLNEMEQKKLLTPSIARHASFTLDIDDFFYFVGSGGGGGGGYGITLKNDEKMTYEYLLGLLNSKLLDTFLKSISSPFSGGYYAYNRQFIEQLPIRPINFSSSSDKALHDKMVSLVSSILHLNKNLPLAKTDQEKTIIQRQLDSTDRRIDELVYELYGLTGEEIKIVEETSERK